jgi:hypothetical protein
MSGFSTNELLKSLSNYPVSKNDVPGHAFHGNQYTTPSQVAGKNVDGSSGTYVEGRNGVFRSNLNSEFQKRQSGDTLKAIKDHFSTLRLRNRQEVKLTKGSPDVAKVICKHCGKPLSEPEKGQTKPQDIVNVTYDPKTKDFVRNPDGSVQGEHYNESWGQAMNDVMAFGRKMGM